MRRYRKPALVSLALVSALFLTIHRHRRGDDHFGLTLDTGDPSSADPGTSGPFDLAALHDTHLTLAHIRDDYVDPTRVDPKAMLLSALDAVQKDVAEIMVEPSADKNQVTVQVLGSRQTFDISGVDSPWALEDKLKEIFRFVQPHLAPGADRKRLQNIEYTAINGMLETLDPHSTLLDPTTYTEMKITTRGSFGGIGVTLGLRNGDLTVINVLAGDTPANKVGLKANDRIMVINDESTVNMTLQDAVTRLRGDPDTAVHIKVARDGVASLLPMTLVRAVIQVPSVQAHLMDGGVGYIKLGTPSTGFAQNTADELAQAIQQLKAQGAHAWILDLRGNPGGLLEQAIKVTDQFVKEGPIVTTVGYAGKKREEKDASGRGGEPGPMAVLIDGRSASASEIVAGALKNLDRAVVIGQRSFGKGSVQILYDNDDGSALKLTIAQYLTPGDISIQSVGITPDIALDPVNVPLRPGSYKDALQLFTEPKVMHEWDLDAHLTHKSARHHEQPLYRVKYLRDHTPAEVADNGPASAPVAPIDRGKGPHGKGAGHAGRAALPGVNPDAPSGPDDDADSDDTPSPDEDPDNPDPAHWKPDYEDLFADELLAQAHSSKRTDVLAESKGLIAKAQKDEEAKVDQALAKLGIDWATGTSTTGAPSLKATFTTDAQLGKVSAGQVVTLRATVANAGPGTAYEVHATVDSDDPDFKDKELAFGEIKPGETRTATVPVRVEKDAITRIDALKLEFGEQNGAKVTAPDVKLAIEALPEPQFAYSYQIVDAAPGGNGDGLVERGENPTLRVTVANVGHGRSYKTEATLADKSGDGINIDKGRFALNDMKPGESRTVDFTFGVDPTYGIAPNPPKDDFDLELSVYDETLRDYVTEKLHFPLAQGGFAVTPQRGNVSVAREGVEIHGGASADSPVIGRAARGAAYPVDGLVNGFYRVTLAKGQPGFLSAGDASPGGGGSPSFAPVWQVSPPLVTLDTTRGLETASPTYRLNGQAVDNDGEVRDLFIFVTNTDSKIEARKVFYRANDLSHTPGRMDFSADLPLWPGSNYVTVVARHDDEVETRSNVVVYRDPPSGWKPASDLAESE